MGAKIIILIHNLRIRKRAIGRVYTIVLYDLGLYDCTTVLYDTVLLKAFFTN